jgi:hypothetical protein
MAGEAGNRASPASETANFTAFANRSCESGAIAAIGRYCTCPLHERINMSSIIRIQDLSAEEIAALLAKQDQAVTAGQAAAIQEFIHDAGGIQQALTTVDLLTQLRKAA